MDEQQMTGWIAPSRFGEADGVGDWRVLGEGACAYFRTGSFAVGALLVQRIGELPGPHGTIQTPTSGTRA